MTQQFDDLGTKYSTDSSTTNRKLLVQSMDAQFWAEQFFSLYVSKLNTLQDLDLEEMRGWFANAIMAGYDYRLGHIAKGLKVESSKLQNPDYVLVHKSQLVLGVMSQSLEYASILGDK